jgi:hypothetical protein
MTKVVLELASADEAMALAQLAKRFTHDDAVRLSNCHDDSCERHAMLEGVLSLQRGLAEAGFVPR